jgi:hypothetical protein
LGARSFPSRHAFGSLLSILLGALCPVNMPVSCGNCRALGSASSLVDPAAGTSHSKPRVAVYPSKGVRHSSDGRHRNVRESWWQGCPSRKDRSVTSVIPAHGPTVLADANAGDGGQLPFAAIPRGQLLPEICLERNVPPWAAKITMEFWHNPLRFISLDETRLSCRNSV